MKKIIALLSLFIYLFLIIFVFSSSIGLAAEKKELKFIINLSEKSVVKKDLVKLAVEMEQKAKIYRTTNQKAYWENEARKTFFKYLRSIGYYGHIIEIEIPENNNIIIFNIHLGTRYKISDVIIDYAPNSNKNLQFLKLYKMGIKRGDYTIAKKILEIETNLLEYLESKNCILNLSVTHNAIIDHDNKEVIVKYIIDAGPDTILEKVEFRGLKTIKAEYVRKLVKLEDGKCIKPTYINEARSNLQRSGLFTTTTPIIPDQINDDGLVPIEFNLTERKARSFKAGIAYETIIGPRINFGWEHRNLFGSGESVKTEILGNKKEQTITFDYTKPFFKRDDQSLNLGTKYENRTLNPNAIKITTIKEITIYNYLEREFTPQWIGGIGAKFSRSFVKKYEINNITHENHSLLSTPIYITHDARDNILNPKKGYFIELETAPYHSLASKDKPFLKTQASASTYFHSRAKLSPILALRASTGTITGAGSRPVAETERFYVGGNNSLRGYAHKLASNMDIYKNPTGGKSFVEANIELRLKINNSIGAVGFLDSGFAYEEIRPQLNKNLLCGTGFGIRYMTTFGPLRFDIGFPLKRRKFIDKSYQLYFGIGQSF